MSLVLRRLVPGLAVSPLAVAAALACAGGAALAQPQQEPAAAQAEAQADAALPAVKATARAERSTEGTGAYTTRSANTATKLDLSLRETPQSISVVTRTQIEDFGLMSVNDLLSSVTGVNVERVETDRTYFSVRGFEVSNFQIDGIGLPFATGDQLGDLDTALYDRVEVLRGANGLMSSTGNPSATVNFVRKRPTRDLQASAGLTFGSWKNRRVDADVSGALNDSGSVRARVVAAAQKKDSHLDRYSLEKNLFSAVVEADLSPATMLTVGHSEQHNMPNAPMWGALPLYYGDGTPTHYADSASNAASWAYWNTDDTQTFAELTHRLNDDWRAKATVTRRTLRSDAELLYVYGTPDRATGTGLFAYPSKYNHAEHQWIADAFVSGNVTLGGRRHEVVVGANWAKSDNRLHSSDDDVGLPLTESQMLTGTFPRPAFDAGTSGFADFSNRRTSLYAAARWHVAEPLKVLTGVNLTRVDSAGEQYRVPHNYEKTKATPYVGVVYDIDDSYSAYASYAGIFNPQHQTDANSVVLPPVEGSNAEIGLKGEWLNKRLNGSVALFKVRQKNLADSPVFDPALGRSVYKTIDATSTGFELDVAGRLTPGWEVSAGYTQLKLEDQRGQDARLYVPRKTLRISTSYRLPMLQGLKLGGAVRWQDDISDAQDGVAGGTTRQDAYALLDLMARYEFTKHLSATLNVNNVTDEKYIPSLYWDQGYWAAPRNVSASFNWQY